MGTVTQYQSIQAALVFIVGLVAVFFIASSSIGFTFRVLFAAGVLIVGVALVLYVFRSHDEDEPVEITATVKSDGIDLEEELSTLEEAAVFFSASIEPEEMLRLVGARLESILSGAAVDFFLEEAAPEVRQVVGGGKNVAGDSAEWSQRLTFLAQRSFLSGEIIRGKTGDMYSVAAPLVRGEEVVAVVTISNAEKGDLPRDDTLRMLDSRIGPLVAGSLSFASSVSNALTDKLTSLPNERAMFLILENQVAEAQRYGSVRPLTLIAMDICSFDEINQRFGHAAGDRLLTFAAGLIRDQLRQMDFLARTSDDEFLLILPTAASSPSSNVRTRIEEAFAATSFKLGEGIEQKISLSFGSATFGEDADTSSGLIEAALEKKQLDKSTDKGSVIRFPKSKTGK